MRRVGEPAVAGDDDVAAVQHRGDPGLRRDHVRLAYLRDHVPRAAGQRPAHQRAGLRAPGLRAAGAREREDLPVDHFQRQDRAARAGRRGPVLAAVGRLPQPVAEHEPVARIGEPDAPHRRTSALLRLPERHDGRGQTAPVGAPVQRAHDRRARRVRARRRPQDERLLRRDKRDRRRREPGRHRTAGRQRRTRPSRRRRPAAGRPGAGRRARASARARARRRRRRRPSGPAAPAPPPPPLEVAVPHPASATAVNSAPASTAIRDVFMRSPPTEAIPLTPLKTPSPRLRLRGSLARPPRPAHGAPAPGEPLVSHQHPRPAHSAVTLVANSLRLTDASQSHKAHAPLPGSSRRDFPESRQTHGSRMSPARPVHRRGGSRRRRQARGIKSGNFRI